MKDRIAKLEVGQNEQGRLLYGLEKDIHTMSESIKSIDKTMQIIAETNQQAVVREQALAGQIDELQHQIRRCDRDIEGLEVRLSKRIDKIEGQQLWSIRTILGSIFMGITTYFIMKK